MYLCRYNMAGLGGHWDVIYDVGSENIVEGKQTLHHSHSLRKLPSCKMCAKLHGLLRRLSKRRS